MKIQKKYGGVVVPMVTPFTEERKVDPVGVTKLVKHLIGSKAIPFIIGTTGESTSIPAAEKVKLVKETVKATNRRTLLYAGISGTCLEESVADAKNYHDLGVDVVVSTMPYYYPADENQMLAYFEELANRIPCPLIIYNIPATTHLSIPIDTVNKLSMHENIVGFKDSEKGIERIDAATTLWKNRLDFSYLLGWALQSAYAVKLGADGIVPSTGNIAPAVYKAIMDAAENGQEDLICLAQQKAEHISKFYQEGRTLSHSLSALKAMLSGYGLCGPQMLPPLYRLGVSQEKLITDICYNSFGDLNELNSVK